jgi:phenylacetate-coenzyme A ligase PaaK-like adenylate-forming protein
MAQSPEVQRKNAVNRALRSSRRQYRSLDTSLEKMERVLDRLILRKTRVFPDQLEPLITQWRDVQVKITVVQRGITDLLNVASF